MKKIFILLAILFTLTAGTSNGARYNYTWKDAEGTLNITDYPPPEGAELIDVSVIPIPDETRTISGGEQQKQNVTQEKSRLQNRLQTEAAALRKEAEALRLQAANLTDEAVELRRLSRKQRYKSRYRLRASNKEREAETLIKKADSLDRKANELEDKALRSK